MQTKTLRDGTEAILQYLRSVPYADATVHYYDCCYENLLSYCASEDCKEFNHQTAREFSEFQAEKAGRGEVHLTYALTMRKAAFVLADYLEQGKVIWKRRSYNETFLPDGFRSLLEDFRKDISPALSDGSVELIVQTVRHFLLFLEEAGCGDICRMTAGHVRDFIIREAPRHAGNRVNLTWPIKKFMGYLTGNGKISFDAGQVLLNPVPNRKKILTCFDEEEISAIFHAADKGTALGKRDLAIMKLALSTGMRGADLRNLRLSDIDWRKNEIRIVQEKTDTEIILPLMPDAGNAIADYILNARPKSDEPYVFLRIRRPHTKLSAGANGANMMKRYLPRAGIAHEAGDGKSFHAFRRTAGTNMVRSGVALTTVSQILGHASPESTRRYLSLHDEMLSECCMVMDGLLTRKEGLA